MSDPDPLDLASLDLLPDWVKEAGKPVKYDFPDEEPDTRHHHGGRPGRGGPRRDGRPGGRRDDGGQGRGGRDRRGGPDRRGGDERRREGRGRPGGDRRDDRDGRRPRGGRDGRDRDRRPYREPRPSMEGVDVKLVPMEAGIEHLAKQIRLTGRAYPVFDLAKLVLAGRNRYRVGFRFRDAGEPGPMVRCRPDGSLWLSMPDAIRHFLRSESFSTYYRGDEVEVDPPKGRFTSIAVCGITGELLGPPNYHEYPLNVARIHRERFSTMPLDVYKRRVKVEHGEEIVEKWIEQKKKSTTYTWLQGGEGEEGEEERVFKSLAEVEAHFTKTHAEEVFENASTAFVSGDIPGNHLAGPLLNLLRREVDDQRHNPIGLVRELCGQFETIGLKFIKRKKKLFVLRSKPRPLKDSVTVSDSVRRILDHIRDHPGGDLNEVVADLAPPTEPTGPTEPAEPTEPTEPTGPTGPTEPAESAEPVVGEAPEPDEGKIATEAAPPEARTTEPEASAEAKPEEKAEDAASAPTPEEVAVLRDLRWLVREGYVIEYSSGEIYLAEPRPHGKGESKKKQNEKRKRKRSSRKRSSARRKRTHRGRTLLALKSRRRRLRKPALLTAARRRR